MNRVFPMTDRQRDGALRRDRVCPKRELDAWAPVGQSMTGVQGPSRG